MPNKVFVYSSAETETLVREAAVIINRAQTTWEIFVVSQLPGEVHLEVPLNPRDLAVRVAQVINERPLIYITHEPFRDNWFSHDFNDISVVSTFSFDRLGTGFPVVAYVIYQTAQAILCFSIGKTEDEISNLCHDPAIGCLFDLCSYKPDIRLGMASGSLCPKCHESLLILGASEEILADLTRLLNLVSRSLQSDNGPNMSTDWQSEMISILHISDLHFGGSFRFQPRMIKPGTPPVLEPFGNLVKLEDLLLSDLDRISADPLLPPQLRALASRVDLLVVSGDIASSGGMGKVPPIRDNGPTDEYEQASEFIESLLAGINSTRRRECLPPLNPSERIVAVPGNHDVNWEVPTDSTNRFLGFAKFWHRITGSRDYFNCPANEIMFRRMINIGGGVHLAVVGFNSCTITGEPPQLREIGMVEGAQLRFCERFLNTTPVQPSRKLAIFHHHPVYIPSLAAGLENYDAILQAGKLLSYLQQKNFDLILHGHKHYPMAWVHNMIPYEATTGGIWSEPVIVSSGSLSADSIRLPSAVPNSYQLIGIRKAKDPLRPVCVVLRRKLRRGDILYGERFETDGIKHLGRDTASPSEREQQHQRLAGLASPVGMESSLHEERKKRYETSGGWMLVHRYRESQTPDQEYDISVYLILKKSNQEPGLEKKIEFVRYAVGEMWRGSPFTVTDPRNGFELRLSAYGPFICIAEVHFADGSTCQLERFIDFEMADK